MPLRQHPFVDPLPIATPRTLLRRLSRADLRDFQSYRADAEVARYQGWTTSGDAAALLFLEQNAAAPLFVPGEWFQLGIALTTNGEPGRLIGDIGLGIDDADPTRAEIGFSMHASFQRQGLAAEAVAAARRLAVRHGGVRIVKGITDARNTASMRLLERLGFALAHTEPAVFRGEPCFEHHYLWTTPGPDA